MQYLTISQSFLQLLILLCEPTDCVLKVTDVVNGLLKYS